MKSSTETAAPGLYAARLDKGAPLVACAVWWRCPMVMPADDLDPDLWCTHADRPRLVAMANRRWRRPEVVATMRDLQPVALDYWLFLLDDRTWAAYWAPDSPEARPHEPVDLSKIPALI